MRKLLALILLIVPLFVNAQTGRYPITRITTVDPPPSWTNLVSCFPMNETSGDALDVHGTDNGTVYNGTQTTGGFISAAGQDSISITGDVFDGTATFIFLVNPSEPSIHLVGGDAGSFTIVSTSSYRLRGLYTSGSGTASTDITLTDETWQMVSVRLDCNGDSVRFGINDTYETESFTQTPDYETTILAGGYWGYSGYRGTMRNMFIFSDLKTDSYITSFYNSGSYTGYEDGDPE